MLKKLPVQPQLEKYKTVLLSFINPGYELCLLAKKVDWESFEEEFAPLYGESWSSISPHTYHSRTSFTETGVQYWR